MLVRATSSECKAILRAMATVATGRGRHGLSRADAIALAAANHVVLGDTEDLDPQALAAIAPDELASALRSEDTRAAAAKFLAVMALVDGVLDAARLEVLQELGAALGVHDAFLVDLAEAARGHLAWAGADMSRQNVVSITAGRLETVEEFPFFPYRPDGDAALLARYQALASLPSGTLGREFLAWYHTHGFALPGDPEGLNESFVRAHDSIHLLSGYSTSPQGELLVSTFTAGMMGGDSFGAHILPVLFSWHLGIELNPVAGSYRGALDPEKFWVAWDRGAATHVDCFAPAWDFWAVAGNPLDELRRRYAVPPLEMRFAASDAAPERYRPIA